MEKPVIEFIKHIRQYSTLSDEAENAIVVLARNEILAKGTILSKEGKTCKRLYFLKNGTVRTYFYQDGKDITHWIYPKNNMVTSWHSYLSQTPSKDYIETTEISEVISLTYTQWQELYTTFPELERFGRLLIEEQMALIDDFYKGYYFLSAKEKYQLLIKAIPNITQIANLGHIASMLGISQETLSRARK
ncbi:Crp/Fnr family transcriptional regulator [Aquimarina sp. AU58]|uniref:Crp/Fnr family transcriptional regulator n=1 Tax=Aquimarina sp. AU58 TaxID=1874112 RepID=UPI000D6E066C|nr:Crp/Fnr family transcriptional regulator [Aquimarina sp. AU58]